MRKWHYQTDIWVLPFLVNIPLPLSPLLYNPIYLAYDPLSQFAPFSCVHVAANSRFIMHNAGMNFHHDCTY